MDELILNLHYLNLMAPGSTDATLLGIVLSSASDKGLGVRKCLHGHS